MTDDEPEWQPWSWSAEEQRALPPDLDGDMSDWWIEGVMRTEEEEQADMAEDRMERSWGPWQ
jgi:hypothetical protein